MHRRGFLAAGLLAARLRGAARIPYLEEQHPESPRGRALAEFARSLRIRRGIVFARPPEGELTLDVYEPGTRGDGPLPAILAFGLAGFRSNDTEWRWDLDRLPPAPTANLYPPFLARGRVVAVANLRVSPRAMWPAQRDDARAALAWVRGNAQSLGADARRIGLFGASASGCLVSLVALTGGPGVRAVCSMAGIYDFEYYASVDPGDRSLFDKVIPSYLGATSALYREASPAHYVRAGAPPFLLLHGTDDRRVPHSQMAHFAGLLRQAGVDAETIDIRHYQHGPLPGRQPEPGPDVTDARIESFFQRRL